MATTFRITPALTLLVVLAGGCGSVQKPTASFKTMSIGDVSPRGFTMNVDVDIANPNAVALPLANADYSLSLGGVRVVEAAKFKRETTLADLRFTQESIDGLKARAPEDVRSHLQHVTLETSVLDMPFFKGKGCDACNGSGLKGRQGAYEVMFMTPALRKLILQNVGAAEIKDAAVEGGMLTLRMDGLVKVWKGITTLEQVVRETSA